MKEDEIINLLFERSETVLIKIKEQYGTLLESMAFHIVGNREDAEECINDTLFAIWNSIPPKRPSCFGAYLMKTARNLAIKKYHFNHAEKRNTQYKTSLDELEELFADKSHGRWRKKKFKNVAISVENVQIQLEAKELVVIINRWLLRLSKEKRGIFISRYWYGNSIEQVAEAFDISKNKVKVTLHRLRKDLKKELEKEGYL